jgi:hypothetical protein
MVSLKVEVQGMGSRGGKAENLEERGYAKKKEEKSKPAPSRIRGYAIR